MVDASGKDIIELIEDVPKGEQENTCSVDEICDERLM
jgi:hypothetical protein